MTGQRAHLLVEVRPPQPPEVPNSSSASTESLVTGVCGVELSQRFVGLFERVIVLAVFSKPRWHIVECHGMSNIFVLPTLRM